MTPETKADILGLVLRCKGFLRRVLGWLPGAAAALGLPRYRIRSLKAWIEARRGQLDWWSRVHGPYYEVFAPMESGMRQGAPRAALPEQDAWGADVARYHVFGEVFLAGLPRGRVLGPSGIVVTSDGGIVEESGWCHGFLEKDRVLTALRLPKPERLPGHYLLLGGSLVTGYAHWIFDGLPRLWALDRVAREGLRLLLFGELNAWQAESLALLGVDSVPRVELRDRYVECEYLHFPSAVGETGSLSPHALRFLRERFLGPTPAPTGRRRIYLSRRLAGRRDILNEDEIRPILDAHGIESIAAETLPLREQIALFADAELVVGAHGAGLSNLVFAPPSCRVLEIFTPTCLRWMYYFLCAQLGQHYHYLIEEHAVAAGAHHRDSGFDNLRLDPERLRRALDRVLQPRD